jgi:hypothetical protein
MEQSQQQPQLSQLDKDSREDLLLKILELREQPAYQAVQSRLITLLQLSQRELESEIQLPQLHRLQGNVAAYRKSLGALDDIEQSLKKME